MFRYLAVPTCLTAFVLALPARLHADEAEGVVELVPNNPGPYVGGESVQIDVWIHSLVGFDAQFDWIQFDFRDTSPQIVLPQQVTFDYSTLNQPHGFDEGSVVDGEHVVAAPLLPVPFTFNGWAINCYPCPTVFFVIPPFGSLHIGMFEIQLPTTLGTYHLDVMNADEPDELYGAALYLGDGPTWPDDWRAFTGEFAGGVRAFTISGPIPTVSSLGLCFLIIALAVCGGTLLVRRARRVTITTLVLVPFSVVPEARSGSPIASQTVQVTVDSGYVSASGGGADPVVVFSEAITLTGRTWMRLHYSLAELNGSGDQTSFVRTTSQLDAKSQIMKPADFESWGQSTAFFNGDSVLVELLAYPNTGPNRVAIDLALTSAAGSSEDEGVSGVCGDDDRVFSHDPRVARIAFLYYPDVTFCTAWLFENRGNALFSAEHCCAGFSFSYPFTPVAQFNVYEDPTAPSPEDQYPIDPTSLTTAGSADWCIFGIFPNSSGSATKNQGSSYTVALAETANNQSAFRLTSYGRGGLVSHSQQTATGPEADARPQDDIYEMRHAIDMQRGSSGGAVAQLCGVAFAINVDTECSTSAASNIGTRLSYEFIQNALVPDVVDGSQLELSGSAADCNGNGIQDWCDVGCYYLHGNCEQPCGAYDDCNGNLTPDECEPDTDWNDNQVQDVCDIAAGTAPDCNFNFVIDGKDIVDGFSEDEDEDGVPDECVPVYDCNDNAREDICDIAILASTDVNANAIPDECEAWRLGACCASEGCEYLLELQCLLEGGQFAGGPCLLHTCDIYGPMP